jgi:hypothetical protein
MPGRKFRSANSAGDSERAFDRSCRGRNVGTLARLAAINSNRVALSGTLDRALTEPNTSSSTFAASRSLTNSVPSASTITRASLRR